MKYLSESFKIKRYKCKTNNLSTRFVFKSIFSNSIFIFFSFVNLFIPFFATMMAALNKPNGAIDVIGVGLSVSFITIFNQFLFLISLCIEFVFKRQQYFDLHDKKHRHVAANIMFMSTIVSIILFIGLSFLYIQFSGIYQNIDDSILKGFKYVSIVSISLIFNGFIYFNIMIDYQEKKYYG